MAQPRTAPTRPRASTTRRGRTGGGLALGAALVQAATACVLPGGPGPNPLPAPNPATRTPVILVHGWNGSTSQFDAMVAELKADGYRSDEVFTYSWNTSTTSNADSAIAFATYVDQVRANKSVDKVDVVSHSMGSMMTRHCVKLGGCAGKVDHWISLAGANHGTSTATLCAPVQITCKEMSPGSAFLTALNASPEVTPGVAWFTIWSTNDGVINPATSTVLAGATNNQISTTLTHNDIPADAAVITQVEAYLAT